MRTDGTTSVIEVEGLRKRFGSFTALDGLDLRVEQGQVAGFLGPNGAGKSTTIRILLGMYRRDGGHGAVFGADPMAEAVAIHRRLAYVPGDVNLWPQLTGGECIDLLLSLRGVRRHGAPRRDELIERFELDPTKKASTYSKGNRQKVALIAAFAADCELLVLDEPTSGLDPLMTNLFVRCVGEVAERGTAVLMSSHILAEVEEVCDTVTIVRAGRTVQAGTLAQLRHLRRSRVTATIAGAGAAAGAGIGGIRALADIPGVHDFSADGDQVTFTVENSGLPAVTRALAASDVRALSVQPPSLEELFLHAYAEPSEVAS